MSEEKSKAIELADWIKQSHFSGIYYDDKKHIELIEKELRRQDAEIVALKAQLFQPAKPVSDEREASVSDDEWAELFQTWWDDHGQFVRAGGGQYEISFAFEAWRYLYPHLMQARAALNQPANQLDDINVVDIEYKSEPIALVHDMGSEA